jgi:hypothetical protein
VKQRDLSAVLLALIEAGVDQCGAVTLVVPGEGALTVDAEELARLYVGEFPGSVDSAAERQVPASLRARPFPTA